MIMLRRHLGLRPSLSAEDEVIYDGICIGKQIPSCKMPAPELHGSLRIKIWSSFWVAQGSDRYTFSVSFLTVVGMPSLHGVMKFDYPGGVN